MIYFEGIRVDTRETVVPTTADYLTCERACLLAAESLGTTVQLIQLAHPKTTFAPSDAQTVRDHYPSYWGDDAR